jgi:septum formation protein
VPGVHLSAAPPLILASTSPYRRELLARLRLPFAVQAPKVDEPLRAGEPPVQRATRLAQEKAEAVARQHPAAAVIGSDQVAVCGDEVLDKPGDAARAADQLRRLSGAEACFHTAVAVICEERGFRASFVDLTRVRFRSLSHEEIARYVQLDQPLDCAAAFRSESLGSALLTQVISDDPTGLVGLPLIRLAASLRALGFQIP